ncbi:MAG: cytochrome C [Deltaproteobacteria bacterium]|nr:cytochrome C [Deltaproteobacteria bacterium]
MPRRTRTAAIVVCVILGGCAALKSSYVVPREHPEELGRGRPLCSAADCHQGSRDPVVYQRFDHTTAFAEGGHRGEARQAERLCQMCHAQSFCNDCHANYVELKPSNKSPTDSYRRTPHRGDYLSRHRIDGRVDPTPCFRCHGNPKSSTICADCHGK